MEVNLSDMKLLSARKTRCEMEDLVRWSVTASCGLQKGTDDGGGTDIHKFTINKLAGKKKPFVQGYYKLYDTDHQHLLPSICIVYGDTIDTRHK